MPNPITKNDGTTTEALFSHPLPNAPGLKTVAIKVTYEPGAFTPRHRHGNAFVTAVLLSGRVESGLNDGETKTYGPGESWSENPGDIHSVSRNASDTEPASFIATFIAPIDQDEFVMRRAVAHTCTVGLRDGFGALVDLSVAKHRAGRDGYVFGALRTLAKPGSAPFAQIAAMYTGTAGLSLRGHEEPPRGYRLKARLREHESNATPQSARLAALCGEDPTYSRFSLQVFRISNSTFKKVAARVIPDLFDPDEANPRWVGSVT
ncbi:hypothetical protein Q8F55_009320 [Vanrija albida]|uniref:Cupin type-2 domain-containing protein n=1 Tax=Vanrija albida TaxID=181172 RepID=A0ABR3PTB9_9TREE